jgi:hypothetical protein
MTKKGGVMAIGDTLHSQSVPLLAEERRPASKGRSFACSEMVDVEGVRQRTPLDPTETVELTGSRVRWLARTSDKNPQALQKFVFRTSKPSSKAQGL